MLLSETETKNWHTLKRFVGIVAISVVILFLGFILSSLEGTHVTGIVLASVAALAGLLSLVVVGRTFYVLNKDIRTGEEKECTIQAEEYKMKSDRNVRLLTKKIIDKLGGELGTRKMLIDVVLADKALEAVENDDRASKTIKDWYNWRESNERKNLEKEQPEIMNHGDEFLKLIELSKSGNTGIDLSSYNNNILKDFIKVIKRWAI